MSRFSFLVISCFAIAGCVTTTPPAAVAPTATTTTASGFPARISQTELPTVRAMLPDQVAGAPLSADVDLCVNGAGDTESVRLRRSSGVPVFDTAVVRDVSTWRYEQNPSDVSCETTTVTYVP